MLYFIPWVVLIVAAVVAVPVAAAFGPRPTFAGNGAEHDDSGEDEEVAVLEDDFGDEGEVQTLGDDAFEEFN